MGSGSSSSVRTLFGTLITKCTCWLFDTEKYRSGDDLRSVGSCGATQSWTTLDEEKIATLDDIDTACAADPCADCGEFEVGVYFESLKKRVNAAVSSVRRKKDWRSSWRRLLAVYGGQSSKQ